MSSRGSGASPATTCLTSPKTPNARFPKRKHAIRNANKHSRNDFYLWFGGQLHAKRLLVLLEIFIFIIGCTGLVKSSAPYDGVDITPMNGNFDFFPTIRPETGISKDLSNQLGDQMRPIPNVNLSLSRNLLSTVSYFFVSSVIFTLVGLRLVEKVWVFGSPVSKYCVVNPAYFLIPGLLAKLTFCIPMFYWSLRSIHYEFNTSYTDNNGMALPLRIMDSIRFTFLPVIIMWFVFGYVIYGSFLAYVYVWRRATGWSTRKEATSLSFSLREFSKARPSFLHRLNQADALNKSPSRRYRSWKSTGRPSINAHTFQKLYDLDATIISNSSDDVNVSMSSMEEGSITPRKGSISRANFSPLRMLPTVHEHEEEHEHEDESDVNDDREPIHINKVNVLVKKFSHLDEKRESSEIKIKEATAQLIDEQNNSTENNIKPNAVII